LKRALCFIAVLCILFCSGCRNKDPFRDYGIDFTDMTNSEISAIKQIESEITYTPAPNYSTDDITLIHFTDKVKRGLKAEIAVKGIPNTFYSIRVTYKSGTSQSKALESRTSDENGYIAWRWTVGATTKPGEYPVEILLKDKVKLKTTLTVTDK
jgi:hypothetical protein